MENEVMNSSRIQPETQRWLEMFRDKFGRAPRILHIGNIANNAYNNARLLNEAGLDCDVISYDYYHIMGCPEWEDADFTNHYGDQFAPSWVAAGVNNFDRPRWFAQGPAKDCIRYLISRREGDMPSADNYWKKLAILNGTKRQPRVAHLRQLARDFLSTLLAIAQSRNIVYRVALSSNSGRIASVSERRIVRLFIAWSFITFALFLQVITFPIFVLRRKHNNCEAFYKVFDSKVVEIVNLFKERFPSRSDALIVSDVETYRNNIADWQSLFSYYDVIQAYATDPILPMLAAKRPFIGFEHGTLRSHTLRDDPICRLTSLAYHLADHVFITNGDCIEYARQIDVTRFSPMLHPVDERRINSIPGRYKELREELGVKYVFLCTLRHDWEIKGTDQYIRALPGVQKYLGNDFRVIMTRWGTDLDKSYALSQSLGVEGLIVWSEPLPRRRLIQTLKSVDVLFDQIALPHFGATAPEGIAAGVPVIMSYDPKSTEWLVSEPAPILTAHNSEEISKQVLKALDPEWLKSYRERAAKWFEAHHSSSIVVQKHISVYQKLLSFN